MASRSDRAAAGDDEARKALEPVVTELNPSWAPWRYLVTRADGVFLVAP